MTTQYRAFPALSDALAATCARSKDPMIQAAPELIASYLELEPTLPSQHEWRFTEVEALRRKMSSLRSAAAINRAFWMDQAHNVEAYSILTVWRGLDLLKPALRCLNNGEVIAPAVLTRALIELSTAYLLNANTIEKTLTALEFPSGIVVTSTEFEQQVVRALWGTRLGAPEPHVKQINILTLIEKLSRAPGAVDLAPTYDFLCEIAHPNVIGNARYWSHVARVHEDGSETRVMERTAHAHHVDDIQSNVIWGVVIQAIPPAVCQADL